ncbi:MAG: radical SAM family heme chaperone HemW [Endomicrobium sp.]|jgi:oxygen-independent coproporphyrinogen-3 oxidase|nr:radical SAM family heme chaperone HemW [Endomicrobium sp.]
MLGLYIHIPFCKQKCFYCNFFSEKYDTVLVDKYIDALTDYAVQFKNKKIDSIYIGGGTPSVLSLKQIQKLLQALNNIFSLSIMQEFTFELNPESTSESKLKILKNYGVNRLSIGLQSVEDKSLKFLGRIHGFKAFCTAYDMALKEGFSNINIDLIYGLPGQNMQDWEKALEKVLLLNSQHLSLYPLSIEQSTSFFETGISTNDDIQRDMYDKTIEILAENGYNHYEVSNWAKRDGESFHNSNYWRNFEYIGLGAGAAGYFERRRYKNVANVQRYINLIKNNVDLKTENEYIDDKLYKTETIILGLRLLNEGVNIDCFSAYKHYKTLSECLKDKTLKKENNKIKIAKKYVFVFNQIVSKFID